MSDPRAHVAQLSAWLQATDIDVLDLKGPAGSVRLVRSEGRVVASTTSPDEGQGPERVRAPAVGVFLDRHPMRLLPAATVGTPARTGDVIGYLRVGPLLIAIVAPCDGVVADLIAEPGATVGYGAPLIYFEPTGSVVAS